VAAALYQDNQQVEAFWSKWNNQAVTKKLLLIGNQSKWTEFVYAPSFIGHKLPSDHPAGFCWKFFGETLAFRKDFQTRAD
jgi:hypothetical protein